MSRSTATAALALALMALPAGAAAKPTQAGPSASERASAAQECRAERGGTAATREAFRARYGTNANGRNAFGKCVSKTAKAITEQEEEAPAPAPAA